MNGMHFKIRYTRQTSDNHQISAARGATNLVGKFNFGLGGCIDDH